VTPPFDTSDRQALVDGSRAIGQSGMVVGSAGNLSLRSGDRVLITPRGAQLDAVDPSDLVDVALADGSVAADRAVRAASRGQSVLSPSVASRLMTQIRTPAEAFNRGLLTPREAGR
jgi:L-fuculose-phosphate aldolase